MADDTPDRPTTTQPAPNLSTEHQDAGDARRPSDTLDRDQTDTPGANAKTPVEDRPNVGTVTPEDYPQGQRAGDTDPD